MVVTNLLTPELFFFLILAHPVNNTGTKYVRIIKTNCIFEEKE